MKLQFEIRCDRIKGDKTDKIISISLVVMHLIQKFEQSEVARIMAGKASVPDFKAGDTIAVTLRIIDGSVSREQIFEGVVIAKRNKGIDSSCIVRKFSGKDGVEKNIKIYSPIVLRIEVLKRGIVRRAKLYYLRKLSGKAARIREDITYRRSSVSV